MKTQTREEKLETALKMILFELSTMPPFPGMPHMPFGITYSIKLATDALNEKDTGQNDK